MKSCPLETSPLDRELIADTLARVGDKWSIQVLWSLEDQAVRFNELRRRLTVSQKVLTACLRSLERDGLVSRTSAPSQSPKVEYALTDRGRELLGPVRDLARWTYERSEDIQISRRRYGEA